MRTWTDKLYTWFFPSRRVADVPSRQKHLVVLLLAGFAVWWATDTLRLLLENVR